MLMEKRLSYHQKMDQMLMALVVASFPVEVAPFHQVVDVSPLLSAQPSYLVRSEVMLVELALEP